MLGALRNVIGSTESFLDTMVEAHEKRIVRSLAACEKKIALLAGKLSKDPTGKIKGPHWTLSQAQGVHRQLERIFEETYGQAYKSNIAEFGVVSKLLKDNFKKLKIPAAFNTVDLEVMQRLKEQAFDVYHTLGVQTQNQIAQAIYDAVLAGQSFSDLAATITGAVIGHKDRVGRPLTTYAGTYAHDSLMSFYATVHKKKAEDAGLNHYLYYGNVIRDSRPFCIIRAGKVYSKDEIEAWNEMIWKGKAPGDVFIRRGGFRCRHHFHAVRPEWVPDVR